MALHGLLIHHMACRCRRSLLIAGLFVLILIGISFGLLYPPMDDNRLHTLTSQSMKRPGWAWPLHSASTFANGNSANSLPSNSVIMPPMLNITMREEVGRGTWRLLHSMAVRIQFYGMMICALAKIPVTTHSR